jgi:phosphoenolpyruvate carboxykinase (GTP)
MGPSGSEFSKVGIEITDSIYVVLNMRIMTRVGDIAMKHLGDSEVFVKGLHSKLDLDPDKRFICHFPEDLTIWSTASGYGGNVLLGKKCFSLRIASYMGKSEGWLAEHMLILGLQDPTGEVTYIAAAFPSACGKTNLAMLVPSLTQAGYRVWTVGDDIAWMRVGDDGRLWAINPEAGFFGVIPGTSMKTNPNAMHTIKRNTIFTNVVLSEEKTVWWEGMDNNPPQNAIDWLGRPWNKFSNEKGAHPNSRFTAPASQCPSISQEWNNPNGVPISAIVFGGRRKKVAPLIYQSYDWEHGVYIGATMASETTAAATGEVGVVRRDPMAMLPFCGYNMASYFKHWIDIGNNIPKAPRIFHVNWFRTDEDGNYLWPGFGENIRVLKWILARCRGEVDAKQTEIGYVPFVEDIDITGLDISKDKIEKLLSINNQELLEELKEQEEFLSMFGDKLPTEIILQQRLLKNRLILDMIE